MVQDNIQQGPRGSNGSQRRSFIKKAGAASMLVTTGLSGCLGGSDNNGGGGEFSDELDVMLWGGQFAESIVPTCVEPFEEEYGITVNWEPLPAPSEMIAQAEAGTLDRDVVAHWNYTQYRGVQSDVFQEIRPENIPNMDNIVEGYHPSDEETTYDPGEESYSIPYTIGAHGAVYNTEEMDKPNSWDDVFAEENMGKVSMPGWMDVPVAIATRYAGYDLDEIVDHEDEVFGIIEEWDDYMYTWWGSGTEMENFLADGSVVTGMLWWARTYGIQQDGVPVDYTIPEEGTDAWVEVYSIPEGVEDPRRRTAEEFMNFIVAEEQRRELVELMPYAVAYEWEDRPEILGEDHPEQHLLDSDRIQIWDSEILEANREEWSLRFQEIIAD